MQKYWRGCSCFVAVALFTYAFLATATIVPCDVWDVDEAIEIENGVGLVSGLGLKYHPRNSRTGKIDYDTYLAWTIGAVEETCNQNMSYIDGRCSASRMWTKCDNEVNYPSKDGFQVYRRMVPAELVCYKSRGYRIINGNINQTYVRVNATWPAYPNFSLIFEVQAVTSSYTENFGSGPKTDGLEYIINHIPNEVKSTIRIENWPWGGPNNVSFLNAGFLGAASTGVGNTTINMTLAQEGSHLLVKTPNFLLKQNMTHFLALDGEPVLKTWAPHIYRNFELTNPYTLSFYMPFSICRDQGLDYLPHFDILEYDPQFSSVFLGDDGFQPQLPPQQQKKSKAAAIAAGVSVAVVLLVVAGIITYFIWRPRSESFSKISSKKKNDDVVSSSSKTRQ